MTSSFDRASNFVLAGLPADVYQRVSSHLHVEHLELGEDLSDEDRPSPAVYFPLSGIVSLVTSTDEGDSIESMLLGREGVVGFWLALGISEPLWASIIQADGDALVMPVDEFQRLLAEEVQFRDRVLRHAGAVMMAMSQSVACNRFHALDSRLARWLLMMRDRLDEDEFRITHAFMGLMLGVHRPSVTLALQALVRAGLVEQSARGRLRITDRAGLEDAACECYSRAPGLPERRPSRR